MEKHVKHVQAELPEATYARLRRRAAREKRPIKALVRAAVESYLGEAQGPDPLDEFIGSIEIEGDWSSRKGWRDPIAKHERKSRRQ